MAQINKSVRFKMHLIFLKSAHLSFKKKENVEFESDICIVSSLFSILILSCVFDSWKTKTNIHVNVWCSTCRRNICDVVTFSCRRLFFVFLIGSVKMLSDVSLSRRHQRHSCGCALLHFLRPLCVDRFSGSTGET